MSGRCTDHSVSMTKDKGVRWTWRSDHPEAPRHGASTQVRGTMKHATFQTSDGRGAQLTTTRFTSAQRRGCDVRPTRKLSSRTLEPCTVARRVRGQHDGVSHVNHLSRGPCPMHMNRRCRGSHRVVQRHVAMQSSPTIWSTRSWARPMANRSRSMNRMLFLF